MKKTSHQRAMKPYGNGFDAVTCKADIRAFVTWWNEKSYFPAETDPAGAAGPGYRMAA